MSKKALSGKITLIFAILATLYPSIPVQAADTDDALLNILPNDCLFCLRINNFNESLGKLDQYLAGASPIPVSLAMMVNMQLGAMVGDPMMSGIDLGGEFAVFALPPQADEMEPVVGMLIPVTDYKTFVTNNPNCTEGDGGIATLSAPNSPVGGFVMAEAGNGKYAIVVSEIVKDKLSILKEAIAKSSKPLAQRISSAQTKDAVTAPAWAYINLAGLYEKYNPMINGAIQMLQQQVSAETAPPEMAQMKEMLEFYVKILPEIVKELGGSADSMTLALTPEPTILNLDLALRAKDGSKLSGIFVKNPKAEGSYTMTGYLDNNNAVNGLMKMNTPSTKKMCDLIFEIMNNTSEESALKEQINQFKTELDKTYDAMGDEVSFSFSYAGGTPPFKLTEVVDVKDVGVMKEYMQNSSNFVTPMYKSMGIPIEMKCDPEVSTYKNATIGTFILKTSVSDDPNMMTMQKEIDKIYGPDGLKYYFAYTPDKFFMAMGPDAENSLKKLIDASPATAAPSGDIKIAMDALKDTPYNDFVCSVNVIKLMKGMGEMMQSMGEANPGAGFFSGLKDIQSQSCLVAGGNAADGQAAMRLAIPKQHLIETVAAAMQMQQQAMAMQQQMQNAPPDQPGFGSMAAQEVPKDPLMEWIGKPAPELKMIDLDGQIHRVSRLKGKKTMLDFWATWCSPCKKSIPDLIALRTKSNDSELVIIGLSDEPADTVKPFAANAKINYPVVCYSDADVAEPYSQIKSIPTLILIDSEGIIRDILTGYHEPEEIQARLSKLD